VKEAVEKALACLSKLQLATGGYGYQGTENTESTAQVLVALSALGLDPETDARFIKEGNTLLSALLAFEKEDGSFSHELGGETNQMASEQAYYALTAYYRMKEGKTGLYAMQDIEAGFRSGDADGNGSITSEDALAILKQVVGTPQEGFLEEAADCDATPGITADDALIILKYVVGII
jgi:hypothetical protein